MHSPTQESRDPGEGPSTDHLATVLAGDAHSVNLSEFASSVIVGTEEGDGTSTAMEGWLWPGEKPNIWKGWSLNRSPSSLADPLLIQQGQETGTGIAASTWEEEEAWGPWCFAFSKPVWETGRMGRQSIIRECSLFLKRNDIEHYRIS